MTSQTPHIEERKKIHEAYRNELLKRHYSNGENFDKAILTYSSAGLALSLAFLKDFVSISNAECAWMLFISWGCFIFAIILTIVSYPIGQAAIDRALESAEQYYLQGIETALNAKSIPAKWVDGLGFGSGILFVCAIILTTLFVSFNLDRSINMVSKPRELSNALGAPRMQSAQDAASVPRMQAVPAPTPAKTETVASPATSQASPPVAPAVAPSPAKSAE